MFWISERRLFMPRASTRRTATCQTWRQSWAVAREVEGTARQWKPACGWRSCGTGACRNGSIPRLNSANLDRRRSRPQKFSSPRPGSFCVSRGEPIKALERGGISGVMIFQGTVRKAKSSGTSVNWPGLNLMGPEQRSCLRLSGSATRWSASA